MSNPNGGFTWRSWDDVQDEALASQRRAEAEEMTLGELVHEKRMEQAVELDAEMKQLLEDMK